MKVQILVVLLLTITACGKREESNYPTPETVETYAAVCNYTAEDGLPMVARYNTYKAVVFVMADVLTKISTARSCKADPDAYARMMDESYTLSYNESELLVRIEKKK